MPRKKNTATDTVTVGQYLTMRLEQLGLRHVFGIPGDYVLRMFDYLVDSKRIDIVQTCDEQGAGFAADAYARVNGVGALCITYCVGGLKTVNAVAGAYAEKAPVIVISGAPGLSERARSPLLHHRVKDFQTQLSVYEKVTVLARAVEDPKEAPKIIDQCLIACLHNKRPVYIEIPRDLVDAPCPAPGKLNLAKPKSETEVLTEAINESVQMLRQAKRPVILAGVEVHRYGLQKDLLDLVESSGMPVAATLLGKSIISEQHAQYLGVYEGAMCRENVRKTVEQSDCLLILGAFMTDINLGVDTANLDVARTINAISERISVSHHHYDGVLLEDFIKGLRRSNLGAKSRHKKPAVKPHQPLKVLPNKPLTVKRFFKRMDDFLTEGMMVIADIGDSLFGAVDLTIQHQTEFLSPAYYTSMGYATPAALGAQINRRKLRPLVFVGDGAFQMTGQEMSSIARYELNPIVFVLNNKGYTTERIIHEGPYNDVHEWAYHLMPVLLRRGWGAEAHTEGELEDALSVALTNTESFSLINVHLDPLDHSTALSRFGDRLGSRVRR